MRGRRGKGTFYLATWVAIAVIGGAAYAVKDVAREEYYLWQLDSGSKDARKLAASKLAELGSPRAGARLIRILAATHDPDWFKSRGESTWDETTSAHLSGAAFQHSLAYFTALRAIKATKAPSLVSLFARELENTHGPTRYLAILQIGELPGRRNDAVPALTRCVLDPEPMNRYFAARVLRLIGSSAGPAGSTLRQAVRDPSPAVRLEAQRAIDTIEQANRSS